MPKTRSLDLVLLETSIFGVNQGYTGRFIGPRVAWILGILNLCPSVTVTYLMLSSEHSEVTDDHPNNYIARQVYIYVALFTIVILQVRYLFRRHKMAPFGRELSHLCQLSAWPGDIYGCITRMVFYLVLYMTFHCLPAYAKYWDGQMGWRIREILFDWSNFVPTAATEFTSQAMLLIQHEFYALCKITEGIVTGRNYEIQKLRNLNRRHASIFALYNKLAGFTGTDSLLIIESERSLILTSLFIDFNHVPLHSGLWSTRLVSYGFHAYRIERIIHYCFRGHRIIMEADQFATTLDKIDLLEFTNDEFFTELQIIRKQTKLRKVQYDCNRFLKLDMKLVFQISKDLLTLMIILIQLTTDPLMGTSKPASNATEAYYNVTEYVGGVSDLRTNSFSIQ